MAKDASLFFAGKGENSKPLSLQERGLERGFPDPVKSKDKERVREGSIRGGFRLKVLQIFDLKLTPMIHQQFPKDSG
ncbi:hypothetical protein [Coleofasciculus sp. E1-EBD-02]|uniref:hypothetical protein n=1 Tax=Coleofasciculus sp. E1-EBD-02 TaxID=3068481 RepID=UPI004063F2BA